MSVHLVHLRTVPSDLPLRTRALHVQTWSAEPSPRWRLAPWRRLLLAVDTAEGPTVLGLVDVEWSVQGAYEDAEEARRLLAPSGAADTAVSPGTGWLRAFTCRPVARWDVPLPEELALDPDGWLDLSGHDAGRLRALGLPLDPAMLDSGDRLHVGGPVDPAARRAVALHALDRARVHLEERGLAVHEPVGSGLYDLEASTVEGRRVDVRVVVTTGTRDATPPSGGWAPLELLVHDVVLEAGRDGWRVTSSAITEEDREAEPSITTETFAPGDIRRLPSPDWPPGEVREDEDYDPGEWFADRADFRPDPRLAFVTDLDLLTAADRLSADSDRWLDHVEEMQEMVLETAYWLAEQEGPVGDGAPPRVCGACGRPARPGDPADASERCSTCRSHAVDM